MEKKFGKVAFPRMSNAMSASFFSWHHLHSTAYSKSTILDRHFIVCLRFRHSFVPNNFLPISWPSMTKVPDPTFDGKNLNAFLNHRYRTNTSPNEGFEDGISKIPSNLIFLAPLMALRPNDIFSIAKKWFQHTCSQHHLVGIATKDDQSEAIANQS